jgi:putative ABC transport system substrate-binding protein
MATSPLAVHGQQVPKIPQIGVLSLGRGDQSDASLKTLDAFMPAIRELGYVEGQNIAFERKFADAMQPSSMTWRRKWSDFTWMPS